ncbi:hypothetical protein QM012_008428 [Aureobasidium pullulans]|uniref:DUF7730 domain-containing protein n=1 Tax=Aureobasidium pullulans TaxID=5580 RepID=A0ABR0TL04_AURPU
MPRSTRSSAAASKKTKAMPAKKVTKNDSDPDPDPVDDSSDDGRSDEDFKATLKTKSDRMVRKIQCRIPGGTSAVREKNNKAFTQTIELTSKKPFSLEPVLMIEGPYAGRHVLVIQPEPDENEKFPFLDLPAEIRNMIYCLVLERAGCRVRLSGKHSGVISTDWYDANDRYISKDDEPYSTSLIRVNKQVSVESSPYLFSRHTFEFSDSTMLQRFLEYLGPERVKSLVSISVSQTYKISVRQAYQLLSPAVSLTKLELKHYRYGYRSRYDWSSVLLPLLQSLCSEGGKSRDEAYGIFTMPGVVDGYCTKHGPFWSHVNKECKKQIKAYDNFYKKLYDDMDKAMDKAEAKKEAIEKGIPIKTRAGRRTKAVDYTGMCSDD